MRKIHVTKIALFVAACVWMASIGVAVGAQTAKAPTTTAPAAAALKNPTKVTPESIAAGKTAYDKFCKFCHGVLADGKGTIIPKGTTPSNLIDAKWDFGSTDGEIFMNIKEGVGPKFDMKAMKTKITDPDLWHIVNYLRSIGPKAK